MIAFDADGRALVHRLGIVGGVKVGRASFMDRSRYVILRRARNHDQRGGDQNSEAFHEPLVSILKCLPLVRPDGGVQIPIPRQDCTCPLILASRQALSGRIRPGFFRDRGGRCRTRLAGNPTGGGSTSPGSSRGQHEGERMERVPAAPEDQCRGFETGQSLPEIAASICGTSRFVQQ
jgi:hypothetical protein